MHKRTMPRDGVGMLDGPCAEPPVWRTGSATLTTRTPPASRTGWTGRTPPRTQAPPRSPGRPALRARHAFGVALTALVFALTPPAHAAQGEAWTLTAGQALLRDSNLYRLDDDAAAPGGGARADTVSTTTVGAAWDARLGRQQVQAAAALRAVRHADNTALDHEGHDLRLTWLAQTAGRLGGELTLRRARQLRQADSLIVDGALVRNLETDETAGAVIRLGGEGRLTLEAALGARQLELSASTPGAAALRSRTVSLGARWRPAAVTTLGAALRHTAGRYPGLDEDWRLNALDLSAEWDRGGRTAWWGRLSPVQLRHERLTQRDVTGVNAAAQLRWQASPKVGLALRLQREIGTDAGLERWGEVAGVVWPGTGDEARLLKRVLLEGTYAMAAKVSLTASLAHTRRDLAPLAPATTTPAFSEDRTSRLAVGARWQATERITLGCEAAAERRQVDGVLSTPYTARSLACAAQLSL